MHGDIRKDKIWNKEFVFLCLINLLVLMAMQMLGNTLPLYVDNMGGKAGLSGALASVFSISALLFRMKLGNLADTMGRRILMVCGSLLYAFSTISFAYIYSFAPLFLFRMLQGIGFAAVHTASGAAVADILPKSRAGEGIGYYGLGTSLAYAVGPSLALMLISCGSYRMMFYGTTAAILLAAFLAFFCRYEKKGAGHEMKIEEAVRKETEKGFLCIIEKSARKPFLVQFPLSVALSGLLTFLVLFAGSRGIRNPGTFFIVAAVAMVCSRLVAGKLTDRFSPLVALVPALIMGMVSFLILILIPSEILFFVSGAFYGFCSGMAMPVLSSIVVKSAPAHKRGAANAAYYLSMDLGYVVGGFLWGAVVELMGFSAMFTGACICLLISTLLSISFFAKMNEDDSLREL